MQVIASTDPKPVPGDWSGNGAPVKFSTRETREEGKGWFAIQEHLRLLQHVSSIPCLMSEHAQLIVFCTTSILHPNSISEPDASCGHLGIQVGAPLHGRMACMQLSIRQRM